MVLEYRWPGLQRPTVAFGASERTYDSNYRSAARLGEIVGKRGPIRMEPGQIDAVADYERMLTRYPVAPLEPVGRCLGYENDPGRAPCRCDRETLPYRFPGAQIMGDVMKGAYRFTSYKPCCERRERCGVLEMGVNDVRAALVDDARKLPRCRWIDESSDRDGMDLETRPLQYRTHHLTARSRRPEAHKRYTHPRMRRRVRQCGGERFGSTQAQGVEYQ